MPVQLFQCTYCSKLHEFDGACEYCHSTLRLIRVEGKKTVLYKKIQGRDEWEVDLVL